jgi:hypothetical protein
VKAVEDSFKKLDKQTLNKVFLTHQQCLEQIILCDGGNTFKLPHMGKERLLRQDQLPVSIGVSDELQAKFSSCNSHNKKHRRSCSSISVIDPKYRSELLQYPVMALDLVPK